MATTQVQREGVEQVAGRILIAWRNGENAGLQQELEQARHMAARTTVAGTFEMASTLEMERIEALSGAVESFRNGSGLQAGAVRLLEHLASAGAQPGSDQGPRKVSR